MPSDHSGSPHALCSSVSLSSALSRSLPLSPSLPLRLLSLLSLALRSNPRVEMLRECVANGFDDMQDVSRRLQKAHEEITIHRRVEQQYKEILILLESAYADAASDARLARYVAAQQHRAYSLTPSQHCVHSHALH